MVYAMFEATLLTGTVQISNQITTLPADTTFFNLPKGMIAPLRMRAPYPIRKATLKGLDDMLLELAERGPQRSDSVLVPAAGGIDVRAYFRSFLADESDATMDFIASPVNQTRPYTGAVSSSHFQEEFSDAFSQVRSGYAAGQGRGRRGRGGFGGVSGVHERHEGAVGLPEPSG